MVKKAFIALGNKGRKYEKTRHNLGWLSVDVLAQDMNLKFKDQGSYSYASLDSDVSSRL